jgi:hypothetical protein
MNSPGQNPSVRLTIELAWSLLRTNEAAVYLIGRWSAAGCLTCDFTNVTEGFQFSPSPCDSRIWLIAWEGLGPDQKLSAGWGEKWASIFARIHCQLVSV